MEAAAVGMQALKIVSDMKRPLELAVGDKTYTIDFQNKKVERTKADKPELSVGLKEEDFNDLVSGKLQPVQAVMQGKIKLKGNMGILMKMQPLQTKLQDIEKKAKKRAKL